MTEHSKEATDAGQQQRAALAARLRSRRAAGNTQVRERHSVYPLSSGQERLWFFEHFDGGTALYNLTVTFEFSGPLDLVLLERALAAVVARHDVLRSVVRYAREDDALQQVILPQVDVGLTVRDLSALAGHEAMDAAVRHVRAQDAQPFVLEAGPLLRASALRMAPDRVLLVLTMHHIITDGRSYLVFLQELSACYAALARGQAWQPEPLPAQYADFVEWERAEAVSPAQQENVAYWRRQLAGMPALIDLPLDRPRAIQQSHAGDAVPFALSPATTRQLREFSRQRGVTPFMTMLAAFKVLLQKYTGHPDVVVGTPVSMRSRLDFDQLVGFFVNTLVLRTQIEPDASFDEILGHVRSICVEGFGRQDTPFGVLVKELQPDRNFSHAPLFQVMFSMAEDPLPSWSVEDITVRLVRTGTATAKYDLSVALIDGPDRIDGRIEYGTALFDRSTIVRLGHHLNALIEAMLARPTVPVAMIPYLAPDEATELIAGMFTPLPGDIDGATLHGLVRAQVGRTPDAVALAHEAGWLTYACLWQRAGALAQQLRALGVGPEQRVGVCMERTPELIVSLLAVLRAGGSYVPLDPAYPRERVRQMIDDCEPSAIVTLCRHLDELEGVAAHLVCADRCVGGGQDGDAPYDNALQTAYIIYTSGSTGTPKGVCISHANAAAMLAWGRERFEPASLTHVAASTSVCFDLSVFEIFLPLSTGGTVCLIRDAVALLGSDLRHVLTLINTVPSAMETLLEHRIALPCLRVANLAGEPLPRSLVDRIHAELGIERVYNLYGPSEDTTYSTEALIPPGCGSKPSIGRPLPGTVAYVLDAALQPVAQGLPGELYLGGAGVSRGYYRRPDLTAERYVPNPFGARHAERLYRTGDLVRQLRSGELEFLGRVDHQIKLRGFRIELGDIQGALLRLPVVREAIVVSSPGTEGEPELVAYLALRPEAAHGLAEVRRALREQLPAHMIPAQWVMLDGLPKTPNGKVDRKALPPPARQGLARTAFEPARGMVQELLAGIWRDVLGRATIGIHDNFFDIGGHSLLAARIVLRIQRLLGLSFPVHLLFETPTIASLAAAIEQRKGALVLPPVVRVSRATPVPLSFAQHRQYMLNQLDPGSGAYNVPTAFRLTGRLDLQRLRSALDELARRHEVLRTKVVVEDGVPYQQVAAHSELALAVEDADEDGLAELLQAEAHRPFELLQGPLARVRLYRLGPAEHVLSLVFHHILTDGWSLGILLHDLGVLYEAGPAALEPLPVQYADFAVWQRDWYASGALEPQARYWQARLAQAPTLLALATDRPRPAMSSQAGAVVRFVIGRDLRTGVERLARICHATPFMVLLALFKLYLHRRSGSVDVCVGIPTTSRTRTEFERVAGYFGNTLVVRNQLDGIADFASFLERVKESCLEAYAHQDLPFERVIELLKIERRVDASPLFQAMFVMENEVDSPRLALGELACAPFPLGAERAKFDLTLAVREEGTCYQAALVYASALFDASTVERMATHVVRLLESILAAPEAGLARLAWMGEAERGTLLDKFSAVQRPHEVGHTLSAQFERSAAARPDAMALVDGNVQLTYRELNRRANRLAHHLLAHGVRPEARVALIATRGLEQLIGMLAILKAGGAYVPIDPDYPAERIAYILGDAGASVALISESGMGVLPASVRTVIRIGDSSAAGCEHDPVVAVTPANTAYLIYTSGSTGRPKGVQIAHANVVRLFSATSGVFGFGADEVWTLFHSFAFDFSVWEIWGALLYQGRLVCVPYLVSRDAEAFHGLLVEQCVTVLNQTPSAFRQLIQADRAQPSTARLHLQWVVFGGEALDASMLRAWYERHPQRPRLVNMYGITETTVHVTHQLLDHDTAQPGMRCVGRPIEDQAVYVLDRDLQPIPIGLTGELHIGGAGLATAYLNRPDLTAERFVPDPYSGVPGARMYRSGDAGRFAADGRLDHLGRIDEQVKIRGFRIEPGEIHAALLEHPQVDAAIIDVAQGAAGPELVAYVVAAGAAPSADQLRHHLGARLPAHMVPGSYCMIDVIPLTPNGKVDRCALPAYVAVPVARAYVAPVTTLEKQLATIWSEVLRHERVGRLDEFFELGGHSLSASQVVFLVRERLGLQASLRALFEHPRLEAFAHHLGTLPVQSRARPAAHLSVPIPVRRR